MFKARSYQAAGGHAVPGRKAMTNLDSIFKSRDLTLQTKVHMVKAMVFSSSHVGM